MKEKLLLMAMLLFMGGVSLRAASDDEVHADFSNPICAGNSEYNKETQVFVWHGSWSNSIENLGFPTGDINVYEKLVIDYDLQEGEGLRVLFYWAEGGTTAEIKYLNGQGPQEVKIADIPEDYRNQSTNIMLAGLGGSGSAVIKDFYLVKSANPIEALKSALGESIISAELEPSLGYTTESFVAFQQAIEEAKQAKAASDATEQAIEDAKSALIEAQNKLVLADGYTKLTADMFMHWDNHEAVEPVSGTGCDYNLKIESNIPYGAGNVYWLDYANLSDYDKLYVVTSYGAPRFCFNRIVNEGQDSGNPNNTPMIDIPNQNWGTELYQSTSEDGRTFIIDLKKMKEDRGFAHLHCIKNANWQPLCVTNLLLYTEPTKSLASSSNLEGYKTFYDAEKNYQVDENTTIYKATATDNAFVTLTEVEGNVIPKGTPVVLKTDATDYKLTLNPTSEESTDDWSDNLLKASDGNATDKYVLAYTDKTGLGFYQYTPALAAGGVYVEAPASAKGRLAIGIGIEGTTSIVEVESTDAAQKNVYNVAGQKVNAAYKGIVIKNGKKYLNK